MLALSAYNVQKCQFPRLSAACIKQQLQGRIQKFWLGGRESRRQRRRGGWEGVSPYPLGVESREWAETFLNFASQMATFGAFWALSFTVQMHVLHIKSSNLDLKSAAKFTNWGFWPPVVLKRQMSRADDAIKLPETEILRKP